MSFYAHLEDPPGLHETLEEFEERELSEASVVCSYGRIIDLQNLVAATLEDCKRGSVFPLLMSYMPGSAYRTYERDEIESLARELKIIEVRLDQAHLPFLISEGNGEGLNKMELAIRFARDCRPAPLFETTSWSLTLLEAGVIRIEVNEETVEGCELLRGDQGYVTVSGVSVAADLPDFGERLFVGWFSSRSAFAEVLEGLKDVCRQAIEQDRRVCFG